MVSTSTTAQNLKLCWGVDVLQDRVFWVRKGHPERQKKQSAPVWGISGEREKVPKSSRSQQFCEVLSVRMSFLWQQRRHSPLVHQNTEGHEAGLHGDGN